MSQLFEVQCKKCNTVKVLEHEPGLDYTCQACSINPIKKPEFLQPKTRVGSSYFKEMREYRKRIQEQEEEYHNAILETPELLKEQMKYQKKRDELILNTLERVIKFMENKNE